MRLYYKEITPDALNSILISAQYFKENWQLIPLVVKTLNQILKWNHFDEGASEVRWKWFQNRFRTDYLSVISNLESLDLLQVNHAYTFSDNKSGKCKSYLLTDRCTSALGDTNRLYLYKLLTDKGERRKNTKRISKRRHAHVITDDALGEIERLNQGISFSFEAIKSIADAYAPTKRAFTYALLVDIQERDWSLKHNAKDNRIWNPYTQLPSAVKTAIKVQGMAYLLTADIRSCYPSLWATYVQSLVTSDLSDEVTKWNSIFLNPSTEPKVYLANLLGIQRREIKGVLIKYFNGHRVSKSEGNPFHKFNAWIENAFPHLYREWKQTDTKQTGNNIGKSFETRLMLDNSIYQKAQELGLVLGYEYDGFSIYGNCTKDAECIDELFAVVEAKSVELLGIKLVFVRKDSVLNLADMAKVNHQNMTAQLHDNWLKVCRRTFKEHFFTVDWSQFRKAKQTYVDGMEFHRKHL